jgi:hypothetical protein
LFLLLLFLQKVVVFAKTTTKCQLLLFLQKVVVFAKSTNVICAVICTVFWAIICTVITLGIG